MSLSAYFLSLNAIDVLWVCVAPALSLGVYYYLTLPRIAFSEFYLVGLFVSGLVAELQLLTWLWFTLVMIREDMGLWLGMAAQPKRLRQQCFGAKH